MVNEIDLIKKQTVERKNKIVFFVKQGLDSFLGDIITGLSEEYETKKIVVTEYKQIDEGMQWADICWFEWCDELIGYGSKLELAKLKKIICRIHGYEVYSDLIKQPNWKNVNDLIIVAPHIMRIFEENTKDLNKGELRIQTIFCGVNVDKYPLNIKNKGYNLGYLGYINYKKNIPLTLDIFKKLYDMDKRYKLFLAGQFQDSRTLSYINYFAQEHKLQNNMFFDGWKKEDEKIEWFKKIDYMIISSIDEGLCFAAAESMCSGIKPILHNCEGIKDHYDKKYVFNTLDEAVNMITSQEYFSEKYRNFIYEKYNLKNEIEKIKKIIVSYSEKCDDSQSVNKEKFDYKKYWDERYQKGGTSGAGSYGVLADFKAEIINSFLKEYKISKTIEFGCGDGNQLGLIQYKNYIGIDISDQAVKKCKFMYEKDENKEFFVYSLEKKSFENLDCDLVVCLDVLYHIIDEKDYLQTLKDIFSLSSKYVIIYTILDKPNIDLSEHLIYRDINLYKDIYKNYKIKEIIKQKYIKKSLADFIIFEKNDENFLKEDNCVNKVIEKPNKAVVIIPTKNGVDLLIKKINYFNSICDENLYLKCLILDSSDEKYKSEDIISKINQIKSNNIVLEYLEFNAKVNFFEKINDGLGYIKDQLCLICADDDYYNKEGILQSIILLNNDKELVTVRGKTYVFENENLENLYERKIDNTIPIMDDKSIDRLNMLCSHYITQTVYSVYRTKDLKLILNFMNKYKELFLISPNFQEYLFYFLIAIKGKIQKIDDLINIRDNSSKSSRYLIESFFDIIINKTFNKSYIIFKKILLEFFENELKIEIDNNYIDLMFKKFMSSNLFLPFDKIVFKDGILSENELIWYSKKIKGEI